MLVHTSTYDSTRKFPSFFINTHFASVNFAFLIGKIIKCSNVDIFVKTAIILLYTVNTGIQKYKNRQNANAERSSSRYSTQPVTLDEVQDAVKLNSKDPDTGEFYSNLSFYPFNIFDELGYRLVDTFCYAITLW